MFAEDVNLLPHKLFQKMLEASRAAPADFAPNAASLFAAMRSGGRVGFEPSTGSTAASSTTTPLCRSKSPTSKTLLAAAELDWSADRPAILGTLFERGLDPAKRSQLGAHYTDRDKIMKIVTPVIIDPLLAEWAETRAKIEALLDAAPKDTADKLLRGTELAARTRAMNAAEALTPRSSTRLKAFRVLDPACGSGNFLYLALRALKDIEHRANLEAEALGLPRGFPSVGPESVLGIELNPFAAELARVSVWIGEIQWMRLNGFDASRNPILRPLDTIECRDAMLNADGTQADWPEADVVVGNPPFLGRGRLIPTLGQAYCLSLREAYRLPDGADLVCYWLKQAGDRIKAKPLVRAGLVTTNSIRGKSNRYVLEEAAPYAPIFQAWSDEPWILDGAAVRVSMIMIGSSKSARKLDGICVPAIFSDLTAATVDLTKSERLEPNIGLASQGLIPRGPFTFTRDQIEAALTAPLNPNGKKNSEVLFQYRNGMDLTRPPPIGGSWTSGRCRSQTHNSSRNHSTSSAPSKLPGRPRHNRRLDPIGGATGTGAPSLNGGSVGTAVTSQHLVFQSSGFSCGSIVTSCQTQGSLP